MDDNESACTRTRALGRPPHPRRRNVVDEFDQSLGLGERTADAFANVVGSWRFIIVQSVVLVAWVVLNVVGYLGRWDPYPFILLNLMLSFQAAYAAPIIMMSQNRSTRLDRMQAQLDFNINRRAETEVTETLALLRTVSARLDALETSGDRRQGPV